MAEEQVQHYNTGSQEGEGVDVEVKDRGLFDFMHKKKEDKEGVKCEEEGVLVTGLEKLHVDESSEPETKEKFHVEETKKVEEKEEGVVEKLPRCDSSSSSSSSDEEDAEGGENKEKKKKKKGLKEKIEGKFNGKKEEEEEQKKPVEAEHKVAAAVVTEEDTTIAVEKMEETVKVEEVPEEKKGFLEKIKEKLPGQHKKSVEEGEYAELVKEQEGEGLHGPKEKKGILGKLMEKLPGYHKNGGEESHATTEGH